MRKIIRYILPALLTVVVYGCTSFLDRQPDMGTEEKALYKNYASITNYLDRCILNLYDQDFFQGYNNLSHNSQLSDECATTDKDANTKDMNSGNWLKDRRSNSYEVGVNDQSPIGKAFLSIRVANRVLANYENMSMTQQEMYKVGGQAHFFRAWYYFELLKRYGGMPIFDKVFKGDGDDDIPRQTYQDSHDWMAADLDSAILMLPDYWDDQNVGRPTKAAALALRAMTELYAASPLMQNDLESTSVMPYNTERAANAAKLADEAIKYVNQSANYRLVTAAEYKNIFYFPFPNYTHPEHLWYSRINPGGEMAMRITCLTINNSGVSGSFAASLPMPTLNHVNMYDKKGADGNYYPIDDSRSGYDIGNDPFADRDPRFKNNILLPGEKYGMAGTNKPYVQTFFIGGTNNSDYYKVTTSTHSSGRQISGFTHKKFHWPEANAIQKQWTMNKFGTPIYIRVVQLYLDFAEASFEATGSATVKVPGCSMSAEEAINIVRDRVELTPLVADIVADADKFRSAYRRERAVELFMEAHRWWDIRRWMIAHEVFSGSAPIKGVNAYLLNTNQKGKVESGEIAAMLRYEEYDMNIEVRNFGMRNYWYPFATVDVASLDNLKQNPGW